MIAAFTIAPLSDRTLDAGAYLLGAVELAVIVGGLALAAWSVRGAVLPGWRGAPARLVEAVLGDCVRDLAGGAVRDLRGVW